MELTLNEKRVIFQILIQIMKADLVTQDEEIKYLDNVFNEFSLSIDEFDHTEQLDLDYLKTQFSNFSDAKKQYAKTLFIGMSQCDGFEDPRETGIINQLCL